VTAVKQEHEAAIELQCLAALRAGAPLRDTLLAFGSATDGMDAKKLGELVAAASMSVVIAAIDARKESPIRWMELFGARCSEQLAALTGEAEIDVLMTPAFLKVFKLIVEWFHANFDPKQAQAHRASLAHFLSHPESGVANPERPGLPAAGAKAGKGP
jgi:hypothetical protein